MARVATIAPGRPELLHPTKVTVMTIEPGRNLPKDDTTHKSFTV
jgi:hypothetical protein